jgi:hypothetical protein
VGSIVALLCYQIDLEDATTTDNVVVSINDKGYPALMAEILHYGIYLMGNVCRLDMKGMTEFREYFKALMFNLTKLDSFKRDTGLLW